MKYVLAAIHSRQLPHLALIVLSAWQLLLVASLWDADGADPTVITSLHLDVVMAAYMKKKT